MTLDAVAAAVAGLAASVAVARVLGPRDLGYYSYMLWAVVAAGAAGALGIPAAARKYAAEYLGAGRPGAALAVVSRAWRLQTAAACATSALALLAVSIWAPPGLRAFALLGAASILPGMLMDVPTALAAAAQRSRAAVVPSLAAAAANVAGIALALTLGWGLAGLAAAFLAARLVDFALRARSSAQIAAWLRGAPGGRDGALEAGFHRRMRRFCASAAVLQFLNLVVWDRSEVFFLARYCDIREVAFYSIPFNITAQLLLFARAFSSSSAAALMHRIGGSRAAAAAQLPVLFRALGFIMLPVLLGAAALSGPLIYVLFGEDYGAAAPVLALLSVCAIARAALTPLLLAFAAFDIQARAVKVTAGCAALNLALDLLLIPSRGALGAAVANGIAQCAAACLLFAVLAAEARVHIGFRPLLRLAGAAAAAVAPAAALAFAGPPWFALAAGTTSGAVLYLPLVRRTGAIGREDAERLARLLPLLPAPARGPSGRLLLWLTSR